MSPIVQMILVALGGAIGGVGLWGFVGKVFDRFWKREDRELARLLREYAREKAEHAECRARIDQMERRLEAVEHHHTSLVPRWIEDGSKRILWVNDAAMMQIFAPLQKTRDEVEGHSFRDLLGMEAARELDRLDRSALARPGIAASSLLTLYSSLKPMHVAKVAGVGRDRELIYEGYAYCANEPADLLDRGDRRQEEQLGASKLALDEGAAGAAD
jgi:hypothetical protein